MVAKLVEHCAVLELPEPVSATALQPASGLPPPKRSRPDAQIAPGRLRIPALNGYLALFALGFLYIGTVLGVGAGVIVGIAALVRRERAIFLGGMGIVSNIALVLWIFG